MKLYFSGSYGDERVTQRLIERRCCRLVTFAYPDEVLEDCRRWVASGVRGEIMVDSGAFSAWNSGKTIRLEELVDFMKRLEDEFASALDFVFVALDVIPGRRGEAPTQAQIHRSAEDSLTNYLTMQKELRCPVIPIYHTGEPYSHRDSLLQHTSWIGFGMSQSWPEPQRVAWANRAFVPGSKIHGMAATGSNMIAAVPWHSVDSASWIIAGALGNIFWPGRDRVQSVSISDTSPHRKNADKHFSTLAPAVQRGMQEILQERGFDIAKLEKDYVERWLWNIEVWSTYQWRRSAGQQQELFDA